MEVLEHFKTDNISKPRQKAAELSAKTGHTKRVGQGFRFIEAHVHFGQHIAPIHETIPEGQGIAGCAKGCQ